MFFCSVLAELGHPWIDAAAVDWFAFRIMFGHEIVAVKIAVCDPGALEGPAVVCVDRMTATGSVGCVGWRGVAVKPCVSTHGTLPVSTLLTSWASLMKPLLPCVPPQLFLMIHEGGCVVSSHPHAWTMCPPGLKKFVLAEIG